MPSASSSRRPTAVSMLTAALVAAYAPTPGSAIRVVPELMLTIRPEPWARIAGSTAWVMATRLITLSWSTRANSSRSSRRPHRSQNVVRTGSCSPARAARRVASKGSSSCGLGQRQRRAAVLLLRGNRWARTAELSDTEQTALRVPAESGDLPGVGAPWYLGGDRIQSIILWQCESPRGGAEDDQIRL